MISSITSPNNYIRLNILCYILKSLLNSSLFIKTYVKCLIKKYLNITNGISHKLLFAPLLKIYIEKI